MLTISLVLSVIAGFLGHLTRPTLKRDFGSGWFPVACYSEGVLLALPFAALIHAGLKRNGISRFVAAYLLGFLGVGTGVVMGHYFILDDGRREDRI